jgi:hypothetical protein
MLLSKCVHPLKIHQRTQFHGPTLTGASFAFTSDVDGGMMVSEWILGSLAEGWWSGSSWLRIGTEGSFEHGDERSGSGASELVSKACYKDL